MASHGASDHEKGHELSFFFFFANTDWQVFDLGQTGSMFACMTALALCRELRSVVDLHQSPLATADA